MKSYTFSLAVNYQQFLHHYSGAASNVVLMTDCGLRLQLPAVRLRPFLGHNGSMVGLDCMWMLIISFSASKRLRNMRWVPYSVISE